MNNLKKNLFFNVGYQIFAVIMPLILAPYVSRTLGAEGVGIYSYTFSVATCFSLIGMLGISNYGNRTIARIGDNIPQRSESFWNIWSIQIIMTAFACLLYLVFCFVADVDNQIIAYIHVLTVLCSAFDINWFFFGIEKIHITVIRNVIVKLLTVALTFIFVKDSSDLVCYTVIMVLGLLLNCWFLFPFLRKEIIFVKPKLGCIKKHIKPIVVLFFPVLAVSVYKIMDKVMLGVLSSVVQTGYYEYAEKIIGIPVTLITAVGAVMLPRLSAIIEKNETEKAQRFTGVTMEIMMCLTIAMSVGIFSVAKDFSVIFYGAEFSESGRIMMVLSFSVLFQGWANVIRTQYLIPVGEDSVYVKSTFLGAVVNLVMNFLLIPYLQAIGAAIGTVCAELAVAVYQSYKVRKKLPVLSYLKVSSFYLLPAIVMVFVIMVIRESFDVSPVVKLILEVVSGAFVYLLISILRLKKSFKKRSDEEKKMKRSES